MRRLRRTALPVALGALLACVASGGRLPAPPEGSVAVPAETALDFHGRAEAFYARLIQRRFNALETFNDPALRDHFRSMDRFFDYYADLAESLDGANFEKSRPTAVVIEEFLFESPSEARVQVRFVGEDDRPLRPGRTHLVRVDRWAREGQQWWLAPGKL